ncbi:MAG: RluA family pseudouridine synthase [Bacteroidia bacterium]
MPITDNDVLFEDNHLIAIHKPVGILSQGDKTGDSSIIELLKRYIKDKYNKPGNVYVAPLHRLDRPVQGVLLFAKTSKAAERMNKAFKENRVNKTYWAIVEGQVKNKTGTIISFLNKNSKTNIVSSFKNQKPNSKEARTTFRQLNSRKHGSLIELKPITGRSHQLRVHCASEIGNPIYGDIKYGSKHKTSNRSLYLLSRSIEFTHPVTKSEIQILSNEPNHGLWKDFID